MTPLLEQKIESLEGISSPKIDLLKKELHICSIMDLVQHFPFRYEDRTKFYQISEINGEMPFVQLKGEILSKNILGEKRKKRMIARFSDGSGFLELVWFQSADWWFKHISIGGRYIVFGRPNKFGRKWSISHPEIEAHTEKSQKRGFTPVYSSTEALRKRYLDSRGLQKLIIPIISAPNFSLQETLSKNIQRVYGLADKTWSMKEIHLPENYQNLQRARYRLKFEELFYIQLKLLRLKEAKLQKFEGAVFEKTLLLKTFYEKHLSFNLTNAQKRVIKEIYRDLKSGNQMNRLLQGDVGSGKTVVAFISCLLVIGSGSQAAIMAPTEILAQQHYYSMKILTKKLGIHIALLTGSTKQKERRIIFEMLKNGDLHSYCWHSRLASRKCCFQILGVSSSR